MTDDTIERVQYTKRMYLRTEDFTDEQAYHLNAHRQHNVAQHTWGIVKGLDIIVRSGVPYVEPGMATDYFGRELINPAPFPVPLEKFATSNDIYVYIVYLRESVSPTPSGYEFCEDDDLGAPSGTSNYRWIESADIIAESSSLILEEPESGKNEIMIEAHKDVVNRDIRQLHVFLGKISKSKDPKQTPPYLIDSTDRPYAGLYAAAIEAPSQTALIQLGPFAEAEEQNNRIAVYMASKPADLEALAIEDNARFIIDDAGAITLKGETTVNGDLVVDGGSLVFDVDKSKEAGNFWQMYRNISSDTDELRITLPTSANSRLVVGTWDKGKFTSCLEVRNNCDVYVSGNLIVENNILDGSGQPHAQALAQSLLTSIRASLENVAPRSFPVLNIEAPHLEELVTRIANLNMDPVANIVSQIVQHAGGDHAEQEGFARSLVKALKNENDPLFNILKSAMDSEA